MKWQPFLNSNFPLFLHFSWPFLSLSYFLSEEEKRRRCYSEHSVPTCLYKPQPTQSQAGSCSMSSVHSASSPAGMIFFIRNFQFGTYLQKIGHFLPESSGNPEASNLETELPDLATRMRQHHFLLLYYILPFHQLGIQKMIPTIGH